MKLKTRWPNRSLDTKWLVRIPLYATCVLAALMFSLLCRHYEWEPLSWQGILAGILMLVVVIWLVMAPLLIVEQLLSKEEVEDEQGDHHD